MTAAPPTTALSWALARTAAYEAGVSRQRPAVELPLGRADRATLAEALRPRTDLPAFPTSSVDGWAARGAGPWRVVGRILAGHRAAPLTGDGTCVEIATGAMVPGGADRIVRLEDGTLAGGLVSADGPARREWREPGEEARAGEELFPAGTPVTPGLLGLAASCGYDTLRVRPPVRAAVLVFGDELLSSGPPGDGRVRDALGPSVPAWLGRYGAEVAEPVGPVADTLEAHVAALRTAVGSGVGLVCTTGGTMHGPVDHLHPALAALDAEYVVNTVEVRPGFPMLLASVGETLVAGLPGNPQSAIVALASLVAPALAGLSGRVMPEPPRIRLGAPVPGRGAYTHLALVDRAGRPVPHVGSAMLRGLVASVGFAVIPPGCDGAEGDEVALVPLPLLDGERP
jgi:molybdopterin molybdotransferase